MVEGTPHPVWCYLALFLIGSFFFIFSAFKPYRMINSSKPDLKFAWRNTLQHSQLIRQSTIFSWKVVLAEMFILVLDNQKQPSEVFCEKIALKDSANFTGKTCVTAFKPTTLLKRDSNTGVFL